MQDDTQMGWEEGVAMTAEEMTVPPNDAQSPEPSAEPKPPPETVSLPHQNLDTAPSPSPVTPPLPTTEPQEVPTTPEPLAPPEETPPTVADTLPIAPTPPPVVVEQAPPRLEQGATKTAEDKPLDPLIPVAEPVKDATGIPQKVLDLTPAELDAARRLWASRTIHDAQEKSVRARKSRVADNMKRVEHFVKKYGPTTVRTVGLELGMSSRSASAYLNTLATQGKIKVTGATTSRRYS